MQFTDVKIAIKHTLEDKFGYEGKWRITRDYFSWWTR
jgi:hypothetical protein